MSFHVGQRVVCVNDTWSAETLSGCCPNRPKKGSIYHVRGYDGDTVADEMGPGIFLQEITNPLAQYKQGFGEPSFYEWRFRPVIERKTDISVFTALLTPSKEPVRAS